MTSNNKFPLYAAYGNRLSHLRVYLITLLVSIAIVSAFLYLYLVLIEDSEPSFAMLPYYFIVPVILLWDSKARSKNFIQIEPDKITFKNSKWINFIELHASQIRYININLSDVRIATHDLHTFDIELSYAKHSDVKKIKKLLADFRLNALQ